MSARDSIEHVVLLMLENRSFDQMLGSLQAEIPKLDGIDPNSPRSNPDTTGKPPVQQQPGAWLQIQNPLGVDFGHDPTDVDWQIGIEPKRDPMTGFVDDFRSNNKDGTNDALAAQVMSYFAPGTLPVLHTLARNSVVCDRWFSSVPGPTWPNRLFALTGTAAGWREMWSHPFSKPPLFFSQDTIFNRLADRGQVARVYTDNNALESMLFILKRAPDSLRHSLDDFEHDAAPGNESFFPQFAFIEPRFFHLLGDPPQDQHPPHDVARGEALIARIYNALRANQTLFEKTLLIVAWDEHGGFYDHVQPPINAVPPDNLSNDGFDFRRLGVRVPALLVSPWLAPDVWSTQFDHTSILRYVCDKFGLEPLGARAAAAASLDGVFDNALQAPRTDMPSLQANPAGAPVEVAPNSVQIAQTQAADAARQQRGLATVAGTPRDLSQPVTREITNALESDAALTREIASQAEARTIRVLCVHGVGHGDARTEWQDSWREAVTVQVRSQPGAADFIAQVQFLEYDKIFEQDKYKITPELIARALIELAGGLVSGPNESPQRGSLDVLGKVEDGLRWTAGMVMQWIEKPDLRDELRACLIKGIADTNPDVVCAHSLGSLIAYDLFRRDVAGSEHGKQYNGKYFISFGSQIAHPSVRRVFDGRIEPLHALADKPSSPGFAQWFHLFNKHDVVFTRRLPLRDDRTSNLETDFLGVANGSGDVLNHDGASYLGHPGARPAWLAAVSDGKQAARALGVPAHTPGVADAATAVVRSDDPRRPRALIVGIDEYQNPENNLAGCVNDAFLISSVLQENGFKADDIRIVLNERATRQGISERLEWLFDGARDKDVRVFWYSGHGAMIPTYSAHATPAGMEESLVPWDFDWSLGHAFTDSDFRRYYAQLPYGVHFLAGFDCCHAGGLARGGTRVRGIDPPDDVRHRMIKWSADDQMWVRRDWVQHGPRPNRMFIGRRVANLHTNLRTLGQANEIRFENVYTKQAGSRKMREQRDATRRDYGHLGPFLPLMLFACAENQTAAEYEHGAISYGVFSFVAAKTLREISREKGLDATTLMTLVDATTKELTRLGYDQTPQMVGPDEDKYKKETSISDVLHSRGRAKGEVS